MKKIVMFALAMPLALVTHAEEFYQPNAEIQALFVNANVDPSLTAGDFSGGTGADTQLQKLRGSGGAVRLSMLLTPRIRLVGEVGRGTSDRNYTAQDVRYELENTQARGGLRFISPASNGMPVYFEAGADFAYYKLKDKVSFGPSYSEQQAGEDPARDSNNVPEPRRFRSNEDGAYGVGHVATGYRSRSFHGYGDLGYGIGGNDDLFELTFGAAYNLTSSLHLVAEYRATTLEDNDGDIKIRELRAGLGFQF